MSARLIDLLLQLAPRERLLLGALFGIILPLGVVLGVLLPLQEAQKTALSARTEAVALNLWVQDRVGDLDRLVQTADSGPRAAIGTSGIEQALIKAGLRGDVAELSSDSDGVVDLRFDRVRFTRLADWLSAADLAWGYDITLFRFESTETSGDVAATLTLTPQQN
jgi:type II secretory pathway component PulM